MNENKTNINWEITTYGKLLYKKVKIMIIEYDKKYDEQIKDLLVEL